MDLPIIEDIHTDEATNSITIHHSEGALTFVKDDLIKLDFPQQRETTFVEDSVFKWLSYLTLFCLFGGFFNLFIYTKSHLAPDHWKYVSSSLFILILTIPLPLIIKEINRILKSPRPKTFIERNKEKDEMFFGPILGIIFILGLIWTVFAYNFIWMLLSVILLSLITLIILVFIILFGNQWGPLKFIERLVHFYTGKRPKVMTLKLKDEVVKFRIEKGITTQNAFAFLKTYDYEESNMKRIKTYSNALTLVLCMSFILISLFVYFNMDSPFWWRCLDTKMISKHGLPLSYEWNTYFYAHHNFLKVFADGLASNLFIGTFILTFIIAVIYYLLGLFCLVFILPLNISFFLVRQLKINIKRVYLVTMAFLATVAQLFFGIKLLSFLADQYSIAALIIALAPILAGIIFSIGYRLRTPYFVNHFSDFIRKT